jgi:hypothetical protein
MADDDTIEDGQDEDDVEREELDDDADGPQPWAKALPGDD